jgi:hypothetical protein
MSLKKSQQIDCQTNNFFKICVMEIHIGELIRQTAKEENKSITVLASEIHTGRRNMYKILENNDMMLSQLWKISKSLNYNFFKEFNPVVTSSDAEKNKSVRKKAVKGTGQEHTLKFEVKYHMENADKMGAFMMHVHALGEELGFSLV